MEKVKQAYINELKKQTNKLSKEIDLISFNDNNYDSSFINIKSKIESLINQCSDFKNIDEYFVNINTQIMKLQNSRNEYLRENEDQNEEIKSRTRIHTDLDNLVNDLHFDERYSQIMLYYEKHKKIHGNDLIISQRMSSIYELHFNSSERLNEYQKCLSLLTLKKVSLTSTLRNIKSYHVTIVEKCNINIDKLKKSLDDELLIIERECDEKRCKINNLIEKQIREINNEISDSQSKILEIEKDILNNNHELFKINSNIKIIQFRMPSRDYVYDIVKKFFKRLNDSHDFVGNGRVTFKGSYWYFGNESYSGIEKVFENGLDIILIRSLLAFGITYEYKRLYREESFDDQGEIIYYDKSF
jgi:hypothetical protein